MTPQIPHGWQSVLGAEPSKPYYLKLMAFLAAERARYDVYPPEGDVFSALQCTAFAHTNVLLLGQDPYHDENQAHGLCFSVRPGMPLPPSVRNIFKELHDDVGCQIPNNGYLVPWARQGMLMLNAVLTVRAHQPNSHKGKGWETFTDTIIQALGEQDNPVVFLLWGAYAQKKIELIDERRHVIIKAAHPSPLSAHRGFFGSRVFSRANQALHKLGKPEIDWQIPDL
ncbi:MAG TPA: uracil-DNA glycosylase [Anaerolineae bacterium]